jgi:hypothetical protein
MKKQAKVCILLFVLTVNFSCQKEDVSASQVVKLRANVTYIIGSNTYENSNAPVTISGYNKIGEKKWSKDFIVSGLSNELSVTLGFSHYLIESNQWGIHVEKSIKANELWSGRTDGPTPIVHKLQGSSSLTRRLAHYTEYFEDAELGFLAKQKVKFDYNENGKLVKYTVYGFDTYQSLVEQHYYNFVYSNNLLTTVTGYFTGINNPFVRYNYTYGNEGTITSIAQNNFQANVNAEANFVYDLANSTVKVNYTFSNGGYFAYEFTLINANMISEKTTNGSGLCNTGAYTYDNKINPFSLLGYTDFNLTNLSINNRLTEDVNYIGCSFPSLVPQSHVYVYDALGYPIIATTSYKPNSAGKSMHSRRSFIYE